MTATESRQWTIGALLDWTGQYLQKKGSEHPRLDAEVLLAHAIDCRRIELYTRYEEEASTAARARFKELVQKRIEGCPVAYLVGRKEFFSLSLEVTPDVLIPRPESELVVVECLKRAQMTDEPRILDLGTGSGNLAIALAVRKPKARVTTIDISPKASAVGKRNAQKHGVADRVRFLEGDLFSPLVEETFDFVVTNPPYIASAEIAQLPVGVRNYEPRLALDGGVDGFAVFDRIVTQAARFLAPNGWLILEIGTAQHEPARKKLVEVGNYTVADTVFDGARHPRVLSAQKRA